VIEINHFLDIQREEFEDLQALSLIAMASPVPAEGTPAETEESSGLQTAVPQVTNEEGEDAAATDTVPSESSATEKAGEDAAATDTVPSKSSATEEEGEDAAATYTVPSESSATDADADTKSTAASETKDESDSESEKPAH
jgi:hypothetical protein